MTTNSDLQPEHRMNRRRELLIALGMGAFVAPFGARAQPAGRIFQIGYIGNSSRALELSLVDGFRQGLRERGYTEGSNINVQYRWADGEPRAFQALITELIARNVEVLVVSGTPAALAAKKATSTVPIVMATVGDAVGAGIIPSLARPGGNITGLTSLVTQLEGKQVQILHELVPKIRHLALLVNLDNPLTPPVLKSTLAAAHSFRIPVRVFDVRTRNELEPAFDAIAKAKSDALVVLPDRTILASRARLVQFAAQRRLPAIYPFSEFVEEGGLIFYGPNFADMFRRAASYVDKILKGATPADLPVEQPTKFELVVNLKTAKALGIKIPNSILVGADRVIE
jgi:putative tryptophan/tyrosine transport system substrate-binding protein